MGFQMRRGLKNDFDPQKMLPGEWAVSIDSETSNQIVWMCFRAGVVKRMGTYEDFKAQIEEATEDIRELYEVTFNEIKAYMEGLADEAEEYKNTAVSKAQEAAGSAAAAADSATTAAREAEAASVSADEASSSADESENFRKLSESYAHGGTGVRPNENVDSSQYYYEQAKRISQGLEGALLPMGTIAFAQLPVATRQAGYMYNIMDDFTTDNTFKEGAGYTYPAGTNVYYTADGYWDCLSGTLVAGVKGSAESIYRRGFVEITKSNIGLGNVENKSSATIRGELTSANVTNALGYTPLSTTGNAASATKLQSSMIINGIIFDGTNSVNNYATCPSFANTPIKTATVPHFISGIGARVTIKFQYGNTVANPSLNISSTGAKRIYYHGAAVPVNYIRPNSTLELVDDGSRWVVVGDLTQYQIDTFARDVGNQITWTNCTNYSAYRIGKMLFFKAEVTSKSTAAITFATIPEGLRPVHLTPLQTYFPSGSDLLKRGTAWAYTDGSVKLTTLANYTSTTTAETIGNVIVTGNWLIN